MNPEDSVKSALARRGSFHQLVTEAPGLRTCTVMGQTVTVETWRSAEHLISTADPNVWWADVSDRRWSWTLEHNWEDAEKAACRGLPGLLDNARKTLDASQLDFGYQQRPRRRMSVEGGSVCVPSFLGNNPKHMRQLERGEGHGLHVNVWVSQFMSGCVSATEYLQRGLAILSLLEALQIRGIGVTVYVFSDNNCFHNRSYFSVVEVESRPLDLGASSFILAHPAFPRGVLYPREAGRHGCPQNGTTPTFLYPDENASFCKGVLGLGPKDILIGDMTYDARFDSAWVKKNLHNVTTDAEQFDQEDHYA